jgi:hypothetical protein
LQLKFLLLHLQLVNVLQITGLLSHLLKLQNLQEKMHAVSSVSSALVHHWNSALTRLGTSF